MRVYRRRHERFADFCVPQVDRFGRGSLMMWGAISYTGRSDLVMIQGNLTSQRYCAEILRPHLLPVCNRQRELFQQDNARPHIARVTRVFFMNHSINVLPWPSISPDLNPIEHLCDRNIYTRKAWTDERHVASWEPAMMMNKEIEVSNKNVLNDTEEATLSQQYETYKNMWGIKESTTWQSSKRIGTSPEATVYLLDLDGVCQAWTVTNKDNLLLWHSGKALIDMIDEDGNLMTKCLGDTLKDKNCSYMVHLPSGWKTDIRTDGYVVCSAVLLGGIWDDDAKVIDYEEMKDMYPQHYDVIKLTKSCYDKLHV